MRHTLIPIFSILILYACTRSKNNEEPNVITGKDKPVTLKLTFDSLENEKIITAFANGYSTDRQKQALVSKAIRRLIPYYKLNIAGHRDPMAGRYDLSCTSPLVASVGHDKDISIGAFLTAPDGLVWDMEYCLFNWPELVNCQVYNYCPPFYPCVTLFTAIDNPDVPGIQCNDYAFYFPGYSGINTTDTIDYCPASGCYYDL